MSDPELPHIDLMSKVCPASGLVISRHTVAGVAPGIATVINPYEVTPSTVAAIGACPLATGVTTPEPFTVATFVLRLDQANVFPPMTFPFASFASALNGVVLPDVF